jgi:hypothetical protein
MAKTKVQPIVTRESLARMLLEADDVKRQHIIGRALVALFKRQTQAEQANLTTQVDNGVGFTGGDAIGGSLTAKSYLARRQLQPWQVEKWTRTGSNGFPRICKYAKQLDEIARERAATQLPLIA